MSPRRSQPLPIYALSYLLAFDAYLRERRPRERGQLRLQMRALLTQLLDETGVRLASDHELVTRGNGRGGGRRPSPLVILP